MCQTKEAKGAHRDDILPRIRAVPALPQRRRIALKQRAVSRRELDVSLQLRQCAWIRRERERGRVEPAQIKVRDDLGVEAGEEGVLRVEVGAEECLRRAVFGGLIGVLLFVDVRCCRPEGGERFEVGVPVKVDRDAADVVYRADEVLDAECVDGGVVCWPDGAVSKRRVRWE